MVRVYVGSAMVLVIDDFVEIMPKKKLKSWKLRTASGNASTLARKETVRALHKFNAGARGTADVEKCRCERHGPRPITQCGLHLALRSRGSGAGARASWQRTK